MADEPEDIGMAADDKTELRGEIPRWVANVLDAESIAHGRTRIQEVNQILEQWARQRLHAARLVHKLARGYPDDTDGSPPDAGTSGELSDPKR